MIKKTKAVMFKTNGVVVTSSLMNALLMGLNCVTAQPMVLDTVRDIKEFMTNQAKHISSNDLLDIMKDVDSSNSIIDLNLVVSCLKHCGDPPAEIQDYIDGFLVRCVKDVMSKAWIS